jgi:hypothetical protein
LVVPADVVVTVVQAVMTATGRAAMEVVEVLVVTVAMQETQEVV